MVLFMEFWICRWWQYLWQPRSQGLSSSRPEERETLGTRLYLWTPMVGCIYNFVLRQKHGVQFLPPVCERFLKAVVNNSNKWDYRLTARSIVKQRNWKQCRVAFLFRKLRKRNVHKEIKSLLKKSVPKLACSRLSVSGDWSKRRARDERGLVKKKERGAFFSTRPRWLLVARIVSYRIPTDREPGTGYPKNPTLSSGTSPYSPNKGVPPPPGVGGFCCSHPIWSWFMLYAVTV